MRIEKIKITNYKNITDLTKDLSGNLYVVSGDNEKGKTTFASAFKKLISKTDKPEQSVTVGETHGTIEGVFTDPEGKKYTVILDFTNEKETIRMITPEGISTTKVGDIRKMFDYTNIDFEEFIAWSNSAEGKRKQREIVLGLLSADDLEEFKRLEVLETSAYTKRTAENHSLTALKSLVGNALTDDEKVLLKSYNENKELYEKAKTVDVVLVELGHAEERLLELDQHKTNLEDAYQREKRAKEERIAEIQKEIKVLGNTLKEDLERNAESYEAQEVKVKEIKDKLPDGDNSPEALQKLATATERLEEISTIVAKADANKVNEVKLKTLEGTVNDLTGNIDSLRTAKKEVIAQSDLGIPGLTIDEDEIRLNDLAFTKEQLSTSQIITTVFNIMVALNKKTPIFHIGRAESLGKAKLDEILKVAEENNYQVFIDKVASGENLQIEIFEEFKNDNQQTLL